MPEKHYYLLTPKDRIPLAFDKHLYFGRAEGNNIVVDDTRASRRHAELYWDGSSFVIIDLNSSNGTYLNGERIATHVLNNGDEIQIGLQSYRFRIVTNPNELETSFKKMQQDTRGMVTAEMPAMSDALPDTDFNGTLGIMTVTEICQTLELGRRTGLLRVLNEKHEKGLLYFRGGQISGAELGLTNGDDAAVKILRFRRGSFAFRSEAPGLENNVKQKTPQLLLEAARASDEDQR